MRAATGTPTCGRNADAIGLPPVWPHELGRTGATLAAATGAPTKELMRRLGHPSPAAALLYQQVADDRDSQIALDAMPSGPRAGAKRQQRQGAGDTPTERLLVTPPPGLFRIFHPTVHEFANHIG